MTSIPFLLLAALGAAQAAEVPDIGTRKAGADWPGFLGPDRDGKSPERGIADWPAAGPRVVWHRELGESFGSASVARGRLFHLDRFGDKVRLTCLKSETGEELWRSEYVTDYADMHDSNSGPRCCPVVDGDRVYIYGADGRLQCHRVSDGSVVWKRDTVAEFKVLHNFFGVGSTPVVEGDLLIAQVGGSPPNSPPGNPGRAKGLDSGIVAFDKRTGEERYRITNELASYGSPVTATIGGRRWGFVFARGGLVGFEPATGRVDFHYPWRAREVLSVNASTPVVAGDRVFISEAYGAGSSVLQVRPGGYGVVWQDGNRRDSSFRAYWNTPIHVDGHLYGASGMQGSQADLRCVELATGKVKWIEAGLTQCSLLHFDGHFVSLSEEGVLRLLRVNPERYEEKAKAVPRGADGAPLLRAPARAGPVLSRGLLFVRGRDRLVCLDLIPEAGHPLPEGERAQIRQAQEEAAARATRQIEADPKATDAYSRRGDARFFLGDFKGAVADYERMVELDGALAASHWRRGIAYFYAGRHEDAAKQFEAYHSHDDVDRENGIWRYLSQHRARGREKAREGLLKYKKDDREPFPSVYQLFAGRTTADAILEKIRSAAIDDAEREKRYFYAHLYIGLDFAVEGRTEQAREHLGKATASRWARGAGFGPAWMWHVGRLHYEQLAAARQER